MYTIVTGGGMVGGTLARRLLANKHDVVLIDQDQGICDRLYAETGVLAINGSATSIEVLKEAGIDKADIVVAATSSDAENLACAILAKSLGVPEILVRMRHPDYEKAYKVAGVTTIFRVTDLMVNQMMMEIEKPQVRKLTTIGGKAEIFIVVVPKGANAAGMIVKDIAASPEFPSECTFIAVYNKQNEAFSIPRGQQVVSEGDELFLISAAENIKKAADFLTVKRTV